ncbi:MAG: hypothetical protein ACKVX7_12715 [Planctomycetota bacterium]
MSAETSPATWAVIVRHYRENRKKCSVEALVHDVRFHFVSFRPGMTLAVDGFTVLAIDGPELSPADAGRPLVLLDSNWRHVDSMRRALRGEFHPRSLSLKLTTSYPRVSKLGYDPNGGLASIEALYVALRILGRRDDRLLANYHWGASFLAQPSLSSGTGTP